MRASPPKPKSATPWDDDFGRPRRSRFGVPRTIRHVMGWVLVAALVLAFLVRQESASVKPRFATTPPPVARLTPRIVLPTPEPAGDPILHLAPRGIDDAMIVAARDGIDDAMIVNPASLRRPVTLRLWSAPVRPSRGKP